MGKKMIGLSFTSLIMATRKKHHAGLERKCIPSLEQSRLSSRMSCTGVAAQTPPLAVSRIPASYGLVVSHPRGFR